MEIDPDEATREYKERIICPFREVMPADVIASIDEQLSGPCTTEMASLDRFIDFMESDEYDVIVFDTAPTGHTIRLLELPIDWSKHIEESARGTGQTCLGPVQTIYEHGWLIRGVSGKIMYVSRLAHIRVCPYNE